MSYLVNFFMPYCLHLYNGHHSSVYFLPIPVIRIKMRIQVQLKAYIMHDKYEPLFKRIGKC